VSADWIAKHNRTPESVERHKERQRLRIRALTVLSQRHYEEFHQIIADLKKEPHRNDAYAETEPEAFR
jgi:hypothetical protein